jgi:hypothetical protein
MTAGNGTKYPSPALEGALTPALISVATVKSRSATVNPGFSKKFSKNQNGLSNFHIISEEKYFQHLNASKFL